MIKIGDLVIVKPRKPGLTRNKFPAVINRGIAPLNVKPVLDRNILQRPFVRRGWYDHPKYGIIMLIESKVFVDSANYYVGCIRDKHYIKIGEYLTLPKPGNLTQDSYQVLLDIDTGVEFWIKADHLKKA